MFHVPTFPEHFQINSVILILTIVSLVRGRKVGGAEPDVRTTQLVKYVSLQWSKAHSTLYALCSRPLMSGSSSLYSAFVPNSDPLFTELNAFETFITVCCSTLYVYCDFIVCHAHWALPSTYTYAHVEFMRAQIPKFFTTSSFAPILCLFNFCERWGLTGTVNAH